MKQSTILYELVEFIPEDIIEGVIYISDRYKTAIHKCCCGCGEEVVTPISPVDWTVSIEGELVTLFPSIGNWSYSCKSHYWIRNGRIIWAGKMSKHKIEMCREREKKSKVAYFENINLKNN